MKARSYTCGVEAVLEAVGGRWKPLILWHLSTGSRRFGELRRLVDGISEKMLIQQLRDMQARGLVERRDFQQVPPHVAYSLTELGASLIEAMKPLCGWGERHMERIAKPRLSA